MSTSVIGSTTTETQSCPPAPTAKLKPKEHGAYAILAIPITAAIIVAGPTVVGLCISVASVAGFLAHEPLLVAIGHRGKRAQRTTPAARNRLLVLLTLGLLSGLTGFALGDHSIRFALLGCIVLAVISFSVALAGKHRTLAGQLLGVVGLSVPCIPILLAGSVDSTIALQTWITWILGFSATTMAVRGVIAAQKRQSRSLHWMTLSGLTLATGLFWAFNMHLPVVILPMLGMSWYLMFAPPPAKQLKRVGWTLVLGTVITAIWMVALQAG